MTIAKKNFILLKLKIFINTLLEYIENNKNSVSLSMIPNTSVKIPNIVDSNIKFGRLDVHDKIKFFKTIDNLPDKEYPLIYKEYLKKSLGHLCEIKSLEDDTVIVSIFTSSIPTNTFFNSNKRRLIELKSSSGLNIKGQNKDQFMIPLKLNINKDDLKLGKVDLAIEQAYLNEFEPIVRQYDNTLLKENCVVKLISIDEVELKNTIMKQTFSNSFEIKNDEILKTSILTEEENKQKIAMNEIGNNLKKIRNMLPIEDEILDK
jgi:hypothetical protein